MASPFSQKAVISLARLSLQVSIPFLSHFLIGSNACKKLIEMAMRTEAIQSIAESSIYFTDVMEEHISIAV